MIDPMNTSPAPVPFQTYDMASAFATATRRAPSAGAAGIAPFVAALPEALRPVFLGAQARQMLAAYHARYPGAAGCSPRWDDLAEAGAGDLIAWVTAPAASDVSADALQALAAASPATTGLYLGIPGGGTSLEGLCQRLMDAGWMPHVQPSAAGEALLVVQAVQRFAPVAPDTSGDCLFSVLVPSAAERTQDAAALVSPGLAEVGASIVTVTGADSAAEAWDSAASVETAPWVLLCRDDAYFPKGFGAGLNQVLASIPEAERASSLIGFIGIGIDAERQGFAPAGFVVEDCRREDHPASGNAVSIDELAVVVARESLHRIDPAMGWHLWATELCLSAICQHKVFPRIVTLPLLHLASTPQALPPGFHASARQLLGKFPEFGPIPTLNGTIDPGFLTRHAPPADPAPRTPPATLARPDVGRCSICETEVAQWTPHPQRGQRSEFMKLLDAVGSDLSVYLCPHCQSTDRDRHLWHYLRATGLLQRLAGSRVLHIAPERHLEALIQASRPQAYVRGDLSPQRAGHLKLDVEALPFEAGSFDLVICNHVLEHVADPVRALKEFHRCLGPDGVLIAQTPYAPSLKHTLEMNRPVSAAFAKLFYGQEDHVRMFGADIAGYFHAAGFKGELRAHDEVLPAMDARLQGCNAREPFFAFSR